VTLLFAVFLQAGAAEPSAWTTTSAESMATRIEVVLPSEATAAAEDVFAVFRDVEATANEWRPEAELAHLNAAAGGPPVQLGDDLCALMRRGLDAGALTGGAFDVTWAALWGVWDFRAAAPAVPDPALIRERTALIDYRKVELSADCQARLPVAGMKVGLGGIAKGWALDRSAAAVRARGVEGFSISAGGQVMVGGHKDGHPWRIGIRDPRGERDDAFAVVEVTDASVSTSGDYERFFEVDGVRYHHIVDPRTGWPSTGLRSATVIAPDATLADVLSTAVMVLGLQDGLRLVASIPGVEAIVVGHDGAVHATPGVAGSLTVLHPPRP